MICLASQLSGSCMVWVLLRDDFGETIIYYYYLVFSVKCLVYL